MSSLLYFPLSPSLSQSLWLPRVSTDRLGRIQERGTVNFELALDHSRSSPSCAGDWHQRDAWRRERETKMPLRGERDMRRVTRKRMSRRMRMMVGGSVSLVPNINTKGSGPHIRGLFRVVICFSSIQRCEYTEV